MKVTADVISMFDSLINCLHGSLPPLCWSSWDSLQRTICLRPSFRFFFIFKSNTVISRFMKGLFATGLFGKLYLLGFFFSKNLTLRLSVCLAVCLFIYSSKFLSYHFHGEFSVLPLEHKAPTKDLQSILSWCVFPASFSSSCIVCPHTPSGLPLFLFFSLRCPSQGGIGETCSFHS